VRIAAPPTAHGSTSNACSRCSGSHSRVCPGCAHGTPCWLALGPEHGLRSRGCAAATSPRRCRQPRASAHQCDPVRGLGRLQLHRPAIRLRGRAGDSDRPPAGGQAPGRYPHLRMRWRAAFSTASFRLPSLSPQDPSQVQSALAFSRSPAPRGNAPPNLQRVCSYACTPAPAPLGRRSRAPMYHRQPDGDDAQRDRQREAQPVRHRRAATAWRLGKLARSTAAWYAPYLLVDHPFRNVGRARTSARNRSSSALAWSASASRTRPLRPRSTVRRSSCTRSRAARRSLALPNRLMTRSNGSSPCPVPSGGCHRRRQDRAAGVGGGCALQPGRWLRAPPSTPAASVGIQPSIAGPLRPAERRARSESVM